MNDEHAARLELEQQNRELEEKLKVVAQQPATVVDTKSMHSGSHVQLVFSNRRFVIPFAVIMAVAPVAWSCIKYVTDTLQELKSLNTAVSGYEKSQELMSQRLDKLVEDMATSKNTQARQAGYLDAVLPMAGVTVPGAEPGAIQVNIARDPDPVGTKKRPKIVTHTFVPAPPLDQR